MLSLANIYPQLLSLFVLKAAISTVKKTVALSTQPNKTANILKNSSVYLRPFLEGKLREDWERLLFEKYPKPTMKTFLSSSSRGCSGSICKHDYRIRTSLSTSSHTSSSSPTMSKLPRSKALRPPSWARVQHLLFWAPKTGTAWSRRRGLAIIDSLLLTQFVNATTVIRQCKNRHSCRH